MFCRVNKTPEGISLRFYVCQPATCTLKSKVSLGPLVRRLVVDEDCFYLIALFPHLTYCSFIFDNLHKPMIFPRSTCSICQRVIRYRKTLVTDLCNRFQLSILLSFLMISRIDKSNPIIGWTCSLSCVTSCIRETAI